MERGLEVSGQTKTSITRILNGVWRPAVGENSPLQQASESLNDEAWVGRVTSSSLEISQEVGISTGCVVTMSRLPTPGFATSAPGCGSVVRRWLGWTSMGKTGRSGVRLFRCALRRGDVLSSLLAAGDWQKRDRTTQPGRFSHFLRVLAGTLVRARHSYLATNWGAVLAAANRLVEGCRTPDEALVC